MCVHSQPEIVIKITVNEPIEILDPQQPTRKKPLSKGEFKAKLVIIKRTGREDVEWIVLPEHEGRGLVVSAFHLFWRRGSVEVEQKTADGWEEYFDDENQ